MRKGEGKWMTIGRGEERRGEASEWMRMRRAEVTRGDGEVGKDKARRDEDEERRR